MYKKILVPMDGSPLAECVLPHVESISHGCGTESLVLLNVVEPYTNPRGVDSGIIDLKSIDNARQQEAQKYLDGVASRLQVNGAKVEKKVLLGNPGQLITEYVAKNDVSLVVIATHGRSGIKRWLLGSVADKVVRSSCVPVHMVRSPGCMPDI